MPDELEERLRSHAKSFDSLLSLIPAKLYYGEDVSDQWKRKKQTSDQKRAAKMAKLDPDNWKSAKDLMDERSAAAKRKRDEHNNDGSDNDEPLVEPEQPKAVQDAQHPKSKKRKIDQDAADKQGTKQPSIVDPMVVEQRRQRQAEKKAAKKEKRQSKKATEPATQEQQKESLEAVAMGHDDSWVDVNTDRTKSKKQRTSKFTANVEAADIEMADDASTATSSNPVSPIMSPMAESGASSISSIPASISDQNILPPVSKPPQKSNLQLLSQSAQSQDAPSQLAQNPGLDEASKAAARARLSEAITNMRTQRKADSNPRSRQELLDQRRQKEEARRLAKKEQRRKEKEEEARKADEEIERRFSPGGSGSLLASPRSPPVSSDHTVPSGGGNTFSFGRIEFGDGTSADTTHLSGLTLDPNHKRKGPQDVQTALLAAKNKAARLSGLDESKRKQIEEQDLWLTAKKRAHGDRVKDDTSLLKKALKRQESQKRKSEREWTDRKDGVQKAQEMKQRKRTENLNKRKEEKKGGGGGTGKHGSSSKGSKKVKVKRPGFEGSFRGRTGGKKK